LVLGVLTSWVILGACSGDPSIDVDSPDGAAVDGSESGSDAGMDAAADVDAAANLDAAALDLGDDAALPDLGGEASTCADGDGDGYTSRACGGDDCDDIRTDVNPGAREVCNAGVDDDCDSRADGDDGACMPCAAGYSGVDGDCIDVDECAIPDFCGRGGTSCTNLPGTFVCTCAPGYAVDRPVGAVCVNVDECSVASSPCGAGICTDTAGSYECACSPGFELQLDPSSTCVDVDECARGLADCDRSPVASCINGAGGFACDCPVGYAGDGRGSGGCADIDECALGLSDCDQMPAASCTNTPGGFACSCPSGYVGTGRGASGCADVDECAAGLAACSVSPAATCLNTPGDYTCVCPSGYAGTGRGASGCVDINECALDIDGCDDAPEACVNVAGRFACVCPPTFVGDGRGAGGCQCRPGYAPAGSACVDVDECADNVDGCDGAPDACVNMPGGFACSCPPGYAGAATGDDGCRWNDPSLSDLGVEAGAVLAPALGATTSFHTVAIRPGMTMTTLTPRVAVPDRATIAVDGVVVASGSTLTVAAGTGFAPRVVTVVVTAETGASRAYTVVVGRGNEYFKASNAQSSDRFGADVALSADGSVLAVGADREASAATGIGGDQSSNAASQAGAVYVFRRSLGVWVQEAYLKASNTGADDFFGARLALSGDGSVLVVGAAREDSAGRGLVGNPLDNTASSAGAVYVFRRTAGTWAQEAYVKASNAGTGDEFGARVAISADGSVFVVGAPKEASSATGIGGDQANDVAMDAGAVYVFRRAGAAWSQEAYVKASNAAFRDAFGSALALSADGSVLAVGAEGEDSSATGLNGDQSNDATGGSGAAYVFRRTSGVWSQEAYVKASNTQTIMAFGVDLALSSDGALMAIGANLERSAATGINGDQSSTSAGSAGAVYLFRRLASGWSQEAYVKASNTGVGDLFGTSVTLSADGTILGVGAPQEASPGVGIGADESLDGLLSAGAAYVFRRVAGGWSQEAYVKASNSGELDRFGTRIAVSGDGSSLAVAAPQEDSAALGVGGDQRNDSASSAGAVYVY
jgi:HJR/Mrr/RecB family endonuclease